jgi:hypothetical protein
MMSMSSRSEQVWDLLHSTQALLQHRGFAGNTPPLPNHRTDARQPATVTYTDLVERWSESLPLGSAWPSGRGSSQPLALILTIEPLKEEETAFVRSWFENPKVNLHLEDQFYLQPLPIFIGENRPYRGLVEDLCKAFRPRALFCLGVEPARMILGAPLGLDTLRSGDFAVASVPLLTTLAPGDFLRLPADPPEQRQRFKAQVWTDLQRLVGKLRYG